MGINRSKDDDEIIDLRYTKHKEGAKPFKDNWNADPDLLDVLYYIENMLKCHVDRVRC
jgi:hypothetical protein